MAGFYTSAKKYCYVVCIICKFNNKNEQWLDSITNANKYCDIMCII